MTSWLEVSVHNMMDIYMVDTFHTLYQERIRTGSSSKSMYVTPIEAHSPVKIIELY